MKLSRRSRRPSTPWSTALISGLAWGSLAFGAVYPWAYWPLLIVCGTTGILAFIDSRGCVWNWRLTTACLLVIAAVLLQIVPVPRTIVSALSPTGTVLITRQHVAELEGPVESIVTHDRQPDEFAHSLSINPHATLRGLAFAIAFALLLVGTARALDSRETTRVARGIFVISLALALVGIAQKAGSTAKLYGVWQPYYGVVNPFGPYVNGNHFAGWMLMAVPLSIGYFFSRANRTLLRRPSTWSDRLSWLSTPEANGLILLAVGILTMALSLVMTLSRAALISFAAALAILASVVVKRSTVRISVAMPFLVCVVLLSVGWGGMNAILNRFTEPNIVTLNGRQFIWRDTVRMIRDFRLVGTGLNTYASAMASYQTPVPNWPFSVAQAHNDYLQIAAEGGSLVVTPAAFLVLVLVREARSRFLDRVHEEAEDWIRVGAVTGLLAIGLQELADFSLQMPGNATLFVMLCSIAVHRSGRGGQAQNSTRRAL